METRDVRQVKIWGLILNTMGRAESGDLVALATNEEALKNFYKEQLLETPERIDGYLYSFKEGVLRHYNPSGTQYAKEHHDGHGIFSQWVEIGSINPNIYRVDF